MLCLVNTNRMSPPIGPVGLEYVASAAAARGLETAVLDLGLADLAPRASPADLVSRFFRERAPTLVGISFRNMDDCFWPGGGEFVTDLVEIVRCVRAVTDAPIVLGGVGYSIASEGLLERSGADFGIHGDGEDAVVRLHGELRGSRRPDLSRVPGLLWRDGGTHRRNPPSLESPVLVKTRRDVFDNASYFRRGGQAGVETKRGCGRPCIYCADSIAKGRRARIRPPTLVADEVEALLTMGVDALHLCDSEFNLPPSHAAAVCEEMARRGLGERVRWYAYLAVTPFDRDLSRAMRRAGCAGINFTGDSGSDAMLASYGHPHRRRDIAEAIRLARAEGIAVMIDLLLGGPGETPGTLRETVDFLKATGPDCAGAALGLRIYPGTSLHGRLLHGGPLEGNPGIRRSYEGPIDLLRPTFYIDPSLGPRPAAIVRELIGDDPRFFAPHDEREADGSSHNYNENVRLAEAIRAGARGAYWDILRKVRGAG